MKTISFLSLTCLLLSFNFDANANGFREITFKNRGAYNASLEVTFTYLDRNARTPGMKTETLKTREIIAGKEEVIYLASYESMSDITVKVNGVLTVGTVKWDSTGKETITLDRRFDQRACFESKGTIFGPHADFCGGGAPLNRKEETTVQGETACFDKVQGKVAWSTNGDSTWNAANIQSLCQGVTLTNIDKRINCFRSQMPSQGWERAINFCSTNR